MLWMRQLRRFRIDRGSGKVVVNSGCQLAGDVRDAYGRVQLWSYGLIRLCMYQIKEGREG